MTQEICTVGDIVVGVCEAKKSDHPRDFVGVWLHGSDTDHVDGRSIIRVGDTGITDCGHIFQAVTGSGLGDADGRNIHRVGDIVYVIEDGVGVSVTGIDHTTAD